MIEDQGFEHSMLCQSALMKALRDARGTAGTRGGPPSSCRTGDQTPALCRHRTFGSSVSSCDRLWLVRQRNRIHNQVRDLFESALPGFGRYDYLDRQKPTRTTRKPLNRPEKLALHTNLSPRLQEP